MVNARNDAIDARSNETPLLSNDRENQSDHWRSTKQSRSERSVPMMIITVNGCIITVLGIQYLFLVGGFAESPLLQHEIRRAFSSILKVIIPQDVSLTILKGPSSPHWLWTSTGCLCSGAVLFGLDPTIVNVRRSRLTYGVSVLNRFTADYHPQEKKIVKDNIEWCADIFDKFVLVDQSIGLGDIVVRKYTPARHNQAQCIISFYCSESDKPLYVTDAGVRKIGAFLRVCVSSIDEKRFFSFRYSCSGYVLRWLFDNRSSEHLGNE